MKNYTCAEGITVKARTESSARTKIERINHASVGNIYLANETPPACSCGWNGEVDWKASGQRCPKCGESLT
jgi:tRNA(Ile2) C34 agmatinyltransferase TiaS